MQQIYKRCLLHDMHTYICIHKHAVIVSAEQSGSIVIISSVLRVNELLAYTYVYNF